MRVLGEQVDTFAVAVQRGADVLGEVDLGAFPAAPEHVDLGAEFGGQVHVAHHLAERVAADRRSLLVKPPSLNTGSENRLVVTIGTTRPVSASACLNRSMMPLPLGGAAAGRDEVVVVEGDAVGARARSACARPRRGSSTGRVASPNRSRACQPTVHRPKLNLSSRVGVGCHDAGSFLSSDASRLGSSRSTGRAAVGRSAGRRGRWSLPHADA